MQANTLIDVNVYQSRWPFRRLHGDEPAELLARLRTHNVTQAWVGSFDGLFHRDPAGVNARLTELCRVHGDGRLIPFGSVNPALPDWEEDLRRCHEVHKMPGIRLHPNYQGWKLDQPPFARLLSLAAQRGLIVQLALSMEDERTQHPVFRVPHVDVAPLAELVKRTSQLRLVVLNAFRALRVDQAAKLADTGMVCFEVAMLEGVGGVAKLLELVPAERVLFGSHFPLFYFEAALLKLRESALPEPILKALSHENARRLLK